MARFSRSRNHSWSTLSSNSSMDSTTRPRNYDTGFPEPFCGTGNTTLRHPDADTSPNATITASDVDFNKVYSRKWSFRTKHKHAVSYGKLSGEGDFHAAGVSAGAGPSMDDDVPLCPNSPTQTMSSMEGADAGRPTSSSRPRSSSSRSGFFHKLRSHH